MAKINNKSSKALAYLSFLFLPILSIIMAIKNFRAPWAKNIIWIFIAFYGYHAVPAGEGVDILAYIAKFENYQNLDFTFNKFIISLYDEGSTTLDVLEPLLSYSLSKITTNYRILLLCYGIIYGYFYSRNLWYFINELNGKLKFSTLVILSLLLVTVGIWEINGFRFWCAVHIFIYGFYNLVILKKKKGLLFIILSPFMHLGLVLPGLLVVIFKSAKIINISILLPIFLFTFFIAELDLEVVRDFITENAPIFVEQKLQSYTSEDYVEAVADRLQNYSLAYQISKLVGIFIKLYFIAILYVNRKLLITGKTKLIFQFFLFLGIFTNLLSQIPSGGRYSAIGTFLLFGTMMIFVQNNFKFRLQKSLPYTYLILVLFAAYQFRIIGINTFSIHHFINNPIISFFIY